MHVEARQINVSASHCTVMSEPLLSTNGTAVVELFFEVVEAAIVPIYSSPAQTIAAANKAAEASTLTKWCFGCIVPSMAPKKDIMQPAVTPPVEQPKQIEAPAYARVILFTKDAEGRCELKFAEPVRLELRNTKVLLERGSAAGACAKLLELAQGLASREEFVD